MADRRGAVLVLLLLGSCGGGGSSGVVAEPPATPVVPAEVPPVAPPPVVELAEAMTAAIERLEIAEVACEGVVPAVTPRGDGPARLCDGNGERCFLEAVGSELFSWDEVTARTAQGEHPAVLVGLSYQGMVLHGFLAGTPRRFAARPTVINHFYAPVELEVTAGRKQQLVVTASLEAWIEPTSPLEATLPCDGVAWRDEDLDDAEILALTQAQGDGELVSLEPGTRKLYAGPKDGVIATMAVAADATVGVQAFQTRNRRRLITLEVDNGLVFGWVDVRSLGSNVFGVGEAVGGYAASSDRQASQPRGVMCDHDVPVLAIVGGSRLEIGYVESHTYFTAGAWIDRGHRAVELRHPRWRGTDEAPAVRETPLLRLVDGVTLAVTAEQLEGCEEP